MKNGTNVVIICMSLIRSEVEHFSYIYVCIFFLLTVCSYPVQVFYWVADLYKFFLVKCIRFENTFDEVLFNFILYVVTYKYYLKMFCSC